MSKKKKRRKPIRLILLIALAAGVWWLWSNFGGGLGFGTGHSGDNQEKEVETEENKTEGQGTCLVRIEKSGIKLGGKPSNREKVVAACRKYGRASVTAMGDANYGDFRRTKDALEGAGIQVEEIFGK